VLKSTMFSVYHMTIYVKWVLARSMAPVSQKS
jgi:hypothetical protein